MQLGRILHWQASGLKSLVNHPYLLHCSSYSLTFLYWIFFSQHLIENVPAGSTFNLNYYWTACIGIIELLGDWENILKRILWVWNTKFGVPCPHYPPNSNSHLNLQDWLKIKARKKVVQYLGQLHFEMFWHTSRWKWPL